MKKIILFLLILTPAFSNAQKVWGKEIWDVYMNSCVETAKQGFSENDSYRYCACTASKLEKRYPNAADLSKLENDEMTELASLCLEETGILNSDNNSSNGSSSSNNNNNKATPPGKASAAASAANSSKYYGATNWSKTGYDTFMGTCVDSAKDALGGETEAKKYCDCSAYKLQQMYPDESTVGQVTQEEITKIAEQCLSEK